MITRFDKILTKYLIKHQRFPSSFYFLKLSINQRFNHTISDSAKIAKLPIDLNHIHRYDVGRSKITWEGSNVVKFIEFPENIDKFEMLKLLEELNKQQFQFGSVHSAVHLFHKVSRNAIQLKNFPRIIESTSLLISSIDVLERFHVAPLLYSLLSFAGNPELISLIISDL